MTTFEWLCVFGTIVGVLVTGFVAIFSKLSSIEIAIASRVSYDVCSDKRDNCPCVLERNDRIRDDLNRTREIYNHKEER